jgi:D-3-phosphoglycerate dehydrogenase
MPEMPEAKLPAKPDVWVVIALKDAFIDELRQHFSVHYSPDGPAPGALARMSAVPLRGVVTNGSTGFTAAQIDSFPRLEIICSFGAGYEGIDVAAARRRGVMVTNAPGVNDANVADHALALMLALARGLVQANAAVHAGKWKSSRAERPSINGRALGILGLGNIGRGIATRAEAFGMQVGYHTRSVHAGVPWRHYATLVGLAQDSDYLVAACPGGAATRNLVNAEVLEALGPQGWFVNIARGSVVDTAALIEALRGARIAGAGLDVVDGEPEVPAGLLACENVIFTPHVAGRSPEVLRAQLDSLLANMLAQFSGRPVPTPVA